MMRVVICCLHIFDVFIFKDHWIFNLLMCAVVVIVIRDVMCNDLVCLFAVDVMFKLLTSVLRPHHCFYCEFPSSFRPCLRVHSSREWYQNVLMRSVSLNEFAYRIETERLHHMLLCPSFVF